MVQNATDLTTKCDSYFLAKYDKSLLQKVSAFLLQNVTVTLQNATVITKCDDFIPKCDVYYEIRQYLLTGPKLNFITRSYDVKDVIWTSLATSSLGYSAILTLFFRRVRIFVFDIRRVPVM